MFKVGKETAIQLEGVYYLEWAVARKLVPCLHQLVYYQLQNDIQNGGDERAEGPSTI